MKTSFLSFFCGVLAGMVLYTMPGVPFVIELALFCLGLTVGWVLAEPRHPASLPASKIIPGTSVAFVNMRTITRCRKTREK